MQKLCLTDNCYNITKQLAKKLEFLSHVGKYIEDAKKAGDTVAESAWVTIRADEEKHAGILRDLLISEVQNRKL
ncbi:MAG TPA: hypothetical protein VJ792_04565 [Candidatus Nitrosotalea sp.]|nr:hypothetical protein [Candidatus Nitrosotalea sp.]